LKLSDDYKLKWGLTKKMEKIIEMFTEILFSKFDRFGVYSLIKTGGRWRWKTLENWLAVCW